MDYNLFMTPPLNLRNYFLTDINFVWLCADGGGDDDDDDDDDEIGCIWTSLTQRGSILDVRIWRLWTSDSDV